MTIPVGHAVSVQVAAKHVFHGLHSAFGEPVSLWMVGACRAVCDLEDLMLDAVALSRRETISECRSLHVLQSVTIIEDVSLLHRGLRCDTEGNDNGSVGKEDFRSWELDCAGKEELRLNLFIWI